MFACETPMDRHMDKAFPTITKINYNSYDKSSAKILASKSRLTTVDEIHVVQWMFIK